MYGLLQRLMGQIHGVNIPQAGDSTQTNVSHTSVTTSTRLDLNWYLAVVRNRYVYESVKVIYIFVKCIRYDFFFTF